MTDKCNANCKFCYNALTFYPNGNIIEYELNGLDKILKFAKLASIKNVAISGGEPTIVNFNILEKVLQKIKGIFEDYRFHSNGLYLFKKFKGDKRIIDYLIENGFNKISLKCCSLGF